MFIQLFAIELFYYWKEQTELLWCYTLLYYFEKLPAIFYLDYWLFRCELTRAFHRIAQSWTWSIGTFSWLLSICGTCRRYILSFSQWTFLLMLSPPRLLIFLLKEIIKHCVRSFIFPCWLNLKVCSNFCFIISKIRLKVYFIDSSKMWVFLLRLCPVFGISWYWTVLLSIWFFQLFQLLAYTGLTWFQLSQRKLFRLFNFFLINFSFLGWNFNWRKVVNLNRPNDVLFKLF